MTDWSRYRLSEWDRTVSLSELNVGSTLVPLPAESIGAARARRARERIGMVWLGGEGHFGPVEELEEGQWARASGAGANFGGEAEPISRFETAQVPTPLASGLILAPPVRITNGQVEMAHFVDRQLLRGALLFWDQIIIPTNAKIWSFVGVDAEYLVEQGVISRPEIVMSGKWALEDAVMAVQFDALQALIARDGGRWSIARGAGGLSVIEPTQMSGSVLQFELANVVPIPDREVPLEAVLEFKRRREPELNAFRNRMKEVRDAIVASPGRALDDHPEMLAFKRAIADQLAVSHEWQFPTRLASIDTKIDMKTWAAALSGFEWATKVHELPSPIALASGVVAGALASVSLKPAWRGLHKPMGAYEYVWRYHHELW